MPCLENERVTYLCLQGFSGSSTRSSSSSLYFFATTSKPFQPSNGFAQSSIATGTLSRRDFEHAFARCATKHSHHVKREFNKHGDLSDLGRAARSPIWRQAKLKLDPSKRTIPSMLRCNNEIPYHHQRQNQLRPDRVLGCTRMPTASSRYQIQQPYRNLLSWASYPSAQTSGHCL